MDKELIDKLYTLLGINNICFSLGGYFYEIYLKNNAIYVSEIKERVISLKNVNKPKEVPTEYTLQDFITLNIDITQLIEEKYDEYSLTIDSIRNEYEFVTHFLLLSDLKTEDKEILEEIINNSYKYYCTNINEHFGLTFINPFTKKIKLTLVDLKIGKCYENYEEIFNLLLKEFHKNRIKFRESLEHNIEVTEKISRK